MCVSSLQAPNLDKTRAGFSIGSIIAIASVTTANLANAVFLPRVRVMTLRLAAFVVIVIALTIGAIFVTPVWACVLLWMLAIVTRLVGLQFSVRGGQRVAVPLDVGHMVSRTAHCDIHLAL